MCAINKIRLACFISACQSVQKNRCIFPFSVNNATYHHCTKGLESNLEAFQCATNLAEDSNVEAVLEECDMTNCMWDR